MAEPDSPRRLGSASTAGERTERTEAPGDATPATQLPKKGGISLGGLKRSSSHVAAVLGRLVEAAGGNKKLVTWACFYKRNSFFVHEWG